MFINIVILHALIPKTGEIDRMPGPQQVMKETGLRPSLDLAVLRADRKSGPRLLKFPLAVIMPGQTNIHGGRSLADKGVVIPIHDALRWSDSRREPPAGFATHPCRA
jgi:hypothetical protein